MTGTRNEPDACGHCAYDLRGAPASADPRCPECGHTLRGHAVDAARERRFFRRLRTGLVAFTVVALALGATTLVAFPRHGLIIAPLLIFLLAPLAPAVIAVYCARELPD